MTAAKLRVAVVGTGRWARVAHLPGWLRDPGVEVVALADGDAAAAAGAAKEFGVAQVATDYRELLEDRASTSCASSPETSRTSRSPGTRCRQASNVLCEKPVHTD